MADQNIMQMAQLCSSVYTESAENTYRNVEVSGLRAWVQRVPDETQATIVCRGTVTSFTGQELAATVHNVLADVDFVLEDLQQVGNVWRDQEGNSPKVHRGFQNAFLPLWDSLSQVLDPEHTLQSAQVSGHSLGAALAILIAVRLRQLGVQQVKVVLFGCPRVGNVCFKAMYDALGLAATTQSFVNAFDPIPYLPLDLTDDSPAEQFPTIARQVKAVLRPLLPQHAGMYTHVVQACTLDGGFMVLRALPLLATSWLSNWANHHKMTFYIENLQWATGPSWVPLCNTFLPMLKPFASGLVRTTPVVGARQTSGAVLARQTSGCIAARETSGPIAAFSQGLITAAGGQGLAVSAVSAAGSLVGCYFLNRRLTTIAQQLHHVEHTVQELSSDINGLLSTIEEHRRGLESVIRDQSARMFFEQIVTDVLASETTLIDEMHMHGGTLAQSGELFRKHREKTEKLLIKHREKIEKLLIAIERQLGQETLVVSNEKPAALLCLALSGYRLSLLNTQVNQGLDTAALLAGRVFPRLACVMGQFSFSCVQTGEEPWLKPLNAECQAFVSSALGYALSTEEGASQLKREIESRPPHVRPYIFLALDLLSQLLRCHVFLEAARHGSRPAGRSTALTFMNILQDERSLCAAGTALATQDGTTHQAVESWAQHLQQHGSILPMLDSLKGSNAPIRWDHLSNEVKSQGQVKLAVEFMQADVLSEDGREWLQQVVSFADLRECNLDRLYTCGLLDTFAKRESKFADTLLQETERLLEKLSSLVQAATARRDERQRIDDLRKELDRNSQGLREEKDYILFGGGVSAGKTTLVNAVLSHVFPTDMWENLEPDEDDLRTLMPTSFSENTAIVTEIEFFPFDGTSPRPDISLQLLECEHSTDGCSTEFSVIDENIYADLCEVKRYLTRYCQEKPPDGRGRRMLIKVPSGSVHKHPVSIVDTPGLESKGVWEQIYPMIHAKAFLFVWVAALDGPQDFGKEGTHLVDLYHKTQMLLPPLLVLTKWDVIKNSNLKEFKKPERRRQHVRDKVQKLRSALASTQFEHLELTIQTPEQRQMIVDNLQVSRHNGRSEIVKTVEFPGIMLPEGSFIEDNTDLSSISPEYPIHVKVLKVLEQSPMLVATNAAAVLDTDADPEERQLATDVIERLWGKLMPLLEDLSVPMRLTKRLSLISNTTQNLMNIVLAEEKQASTEDYLGNLESIKQKCLNRLSDFMDSYFSKIPNKVHKGDQEEQYSLYDLETMNIGYRRPLDMYTPNVELGENDATNHLLPLLTAQYTSFCETTQRDYKLPCLMAEEAFKGWKARFKENMNHMQHVCSQEMFEQIEQIISMGRSNNPVYSDMRFDLGLQREVETMHIMSAFLGVYGGALGAAVGSSLSTAALGSTLSALGAAGVAATGIGGAVLAGGLVCTAFLRNNAQLAKMHPKLARATLASRATYSETEAVDAAAAIMLQNLNLREFQVSAKNIVLGLHTEIMNRCLEEFKNHRIASRSESEEAKEAVDIQAQVDEAKKVLTYCFRLGLNRTIGSDPWLIAPPADLMADISADERSSVGR